MQEIHGFATRTHSVLRMDRSLPVKSKAHVRTESSNAKSKYYLHARTKNRACEGIQLLLYDVQGGLLFVSWPAVVSASMLKLGVKRRFRIFSLHQIGQKILQSSNQYTRSYCGLQLSWTSWLPCCSPKMSENLQECNQAAWLTEENILKIES